MSILRNLVAAAGVAGTLGAAAPAFADWYRPAPPVVVPPAPPVYVTPPAYGYGYGYSYCPPGVYCRPGWDRDDYWRWRRHRWHEWREHRRHEWREHHGW